MFRDDGRTIAVDANPERIAPLAAAPDVDRAIVPPSRVLVENPAHLNLPFPLRERRRPKGAVASPHVTRAVGSTTAAGTAQPLTCGRPRQTGRRSAMSGTGGGQRGSPE